jgi:hypothetical protein
MRTPGRCTNHQSCWLANGGRDIWVPVGEDFVCPVCAEPLRAPYMRAISMRSLAVAASVSLGLVAMAGGAGFGLVRAVHALPDLQQIAMKYRTPAPAVTRLAQAAVRPAVTGRTAAPLVAAPVRMAAAVPAQAPVAVAAAKAPVDQVTPAPVAAHVAAAPVRMAASQDTAPASRPVVQAPVRQPHPEVVAVIPPKSDPSWHEWPARRHVTLPISFGKPVAPEDDATVDARRWRHRAIGRRSYFQPAGWSQADEDTISNANAVFQPGQGDEEAAAAGYAVADAGGGMPEQQRDTALPESDAAGGADMAGQDSVPGEAPLRAAQLDGNVGGRLQGDVAPDMVTHLVVPSMRYKLAADLPAARVDVAEAVKVSDAPDAPQRLAELSPADPAKLALPAYPPAAEAMERPGLVDVGCVITVRGEPDKCQVTKHVGGHGFADSVMTWLHSGAVRYRPHLVHGQPVPEAHRYDVTFVP